MFGTSNLGTHVNLGIIYWGDTRVVLQNLLSTDVTFLPWTVICLNDKLWHIYSLTNMLQNCAPMTYHSNVEAYAKKPTLHPK